LRLHLDSSFGLTKIHRLITRTALGAPQQEEQANQKQHWEKETADPLKAESFISLRLNRDINLVFGQNIEQIRVFG
jgi:hypothetical protein